MEEQVEKISALDPALMDLDLKVTTKDEAIKKLSKLLLDHGYITDLDGFIADVYLREKEGITGIGGNVAIPHGKSDSASKAAIAVGKTDTMIEWESYDEKPVNLIFLFAVPSDVEGCKTHLKLLSRLAGKLANETLLDKVKEAQSSEEIMSLLGF